MAVFAGTGMFAAAFLFVTAASAQRTTQSVAEAQAAAAAQGRVHSSYDANKEVSVQGTVAKFTENSMDVPVGAHVLVQTGSGMVDVHLGDPRLLKLNKLSITEGSSIRIIGEPVATSQGTFFLARLVQLGTQIVAVRTTQGMPLWPSAMRTTTPSANSNSQGVPR